MPNNLNENNYFGYKNEYLIVDALNNKTYGQVSKYWKENLTKMFGPLKYKDIIKCEKCDRYLKEDILITVRDVTKHVSIKIGTHITMHNESLESFVDFLGSLGISKRALNTLKLYHFGDGTLDGTGKTRLDVKGVKEKYAWRIKRFNHIVNKTKYLMPILKRILNGTPRQGGYVDYIYHGNKFKGDLISVADLTKYNLLKDSSMIKSIHFGVFTYTPARRGLLETNADDEHRYYAAIKWPGMEIDFDKILKTYKNDTR